MAGMALIDQSTGEVVRAIDATALLAAAGIHDVSEASAERLAEFDDAAKTLTGVVKEARGIVSDEFVDRRDREVSGTLTAGPWKIAVPSRAAGTTIYCADATPKALAGLVGEGLISVRAANEACPDTTPPAQMPWDMLARIAVALQGGLDQADEVALKDAVVALLATRPAPTYAPSVAKLDALCKAGGKVRGALAACKVAVEPPKRVAKITRARGAS